MARSSSARLRGRLAFLALLALTGSASATITLSQFPPNPGVLPGGGWQFTSGSTFANPAPPRSWVNGVYGSVPSATVSDSISLTGRAGALAVTARTTVTAAEVALSLARLAGRANVAIAIGSIAYDLLAGAGVRNTGGGAEIDPGSPPLDSIEIQYRASSGSVVGPFVSSRGAALSALVAAMPKTEDMGGCTASLSYSTPNSVTLAFTATNSGCVNSLGYLIGKGTYQRIASIYQESRPVTGCSPIVDALTGQSYVPGVRADGKCMTGRYAAALSEDQIASALKPVVEKSVSEAAKAAISEGGQIDSAGFEVTGPATQIGQPTNTTTTTPSGTTTTSTYSSFSYNYNGDKITYETTVVTNTCAGTGSCSANNSDKTVTTITGKPTAQDPADPCTSDPSRLGCVKLGDPPDDKIPRNNKTVTFMPEVIGLGASCPAPVQLPHGQQISYQTVCDGVVQARPLIIAMGFLMAGGIMLGALRPQ